MYVMQEYDDMLNTILNKGIKKKNRTGIDTISIFGMQCRYKIDDRFPLLTRRKIWPKSIFAELCWFLSGSTNILDLENMGSKIWSPWQDKDFEHRHGYVNNSLGPIYGWQLRHFGEDYKDGNNKNAAGIDQLQYMIDTLRSDPDSRRNLFSLWNPKDLNKQKLACCHYSFQVYVQDNKLSGMLTLRSCDAFIGCPANIQFYSTLLYLLGQQCGYQPYELIQSIGDCHIYENHLDGVAEYFSREIPPSPKLQIDKQNHILDYRPEHFHVLDYHPLSSIKVEVAV
jgi:thymidylate synthase